MELTPIEPPESAIRKRPVDRSVSGAISIARLLCIMGIVYVHGWTGLDGGKLAALAGSPDGVLRWTMVELFGRSSVPLLSLVSGWLVARSTRQRGYRDFVGGKVRAVLAPMVLWNMIAIVLVSGAAMLGLIRGPIPDGVGWLLDEIFCVTRSANINVQMSFLRDLFLCMLAVPLFLRMPSSGLVAIAGLAATWVIGGWTVPILLRPAILLFFVCGILAARHDVAERLADTSLAHALLPFFLVLPLKLSLSIWSTRLLFYNDHVVAVVDLAIRFAAAAMVWRLSLLLAARPIGARLRRLEPYVFLLFCSHLIFMWLLGPFIGRATGRMGEGVWAIYFLVQPLLALGFAMMIGRMLAAVSPAAAKMLSGGRL